MPVPIDRMPSDRMPRIQMYTSNSQDMQFARQVVGRLVESGYIAYFAGGCVRDALLGNEPDDFDVATNASPNQVREVFGDRQTRAVGEAFGVILVHGRVVGSSNRDAKKQAGCENPVCQVEVATFRSDGAYSDGRRPDWVVFSTPEQDAQRRDFTINGLFYDPIAERVIDFVDGQKDLEQKILRAIGDPRARIAEDKLRMLRAIRFTGRFGLKLDESTRSAISSGAHEIGLVSGERIGIELRKIIEHPSRTWAWQTLLELGLVEHLAPEMREAWVAEPARSNSLRWLSSLPQSLVPFSVGLASLLYPNLDPETYSESLSSCLFSLKERWKLSNAEVDSVRWIASHADDLARADTQPWSRIQPLLTSSNVHEALLFAQSLAALRGLSQFGVEFCQAKLSGPESDWNPAPWILGRDLIEAGLRPGPVFSEILATARAYQLDGKWKSRQEALAWLEQAAREIP